MFRSNLGFHATKAALPVAMLCVLGLHGQANAQAFDLIDEGSVEQVQSNNSIVIADGYTYPQNETIVYTALQSNGFNPSLTGQACSGPGCCSCNNAQPVSSSTLGTVVYSGNYLGQTSQPAVVYQGQGYTTQSYPVQSYPTSSYPVQSYPSYPVSQPVVSSCSTCSNGVSGSSVDLGVIEGVNANYVPASSSPATPNYSTPSMTYTSSVPAATPVVSAPVTFASPNVTFSSATPQPVYYSAPASTSQPVYRSPAPTYSAPVYSSRTFTRVNSTPSYQSGQLSQSGLAQSKAVRAAQMGLRGHLGGGLGGAKYEGVGWSNRSPRDAIENCCYWGTRPTVEIGVSKGQDGCWYACVLYQ